MYRLAAGMEETVVQEVTSAAPSDGQGPAAQSAAMPAGLLLRPDGIYLDGNTPSATLLATINQIFATPAFLRGLDYQALIDALYPLGPLPAGGRPALRLAAGIVPFDPQRRALYKTPKMGRGYAEYLF
ncbi:MAG: hypothetical protein ACEQSK_16735 [Sphingomonadaceae bacterium]